MVGCRAYLRSNGGWKISIAAWKPMAGRCPVIALGLGARTGFDSVSLPGPAAPVQPTRLLFGPADQQRPVEALSLSSKEGNSSEAAACWNEQQRWPAQFRP